MVSKRFLFDTTLILNSKVNSNTLCKMSAVEAGNSLIHFSLAHQLKIDSLGEVPGAGLNITPFPC
jgi:hypothetical protein